MAYNGGLLNNAASKLFALVPQSKLELRLITRLGSFD